MSDILNFLDYIYIYIYIYIGKISNGSLWCEKKKGNMDN